MPEVIHRDVSGWAFAMRPGEVAAMLADVDCFCFGADVASEISLIDTC